MIGGGRDDQRGRVLQLAGSNAGTGAGGPAGNDTGVVRREGEVHEVVGDRHEEVAQLVDGDAEVLDLFEIAPRTSGGVGRDQPDRAEELRGRRNDEMDVVTRGVEGRADRLPSIRIHVARALPSLPTGVPSSRPPQTLAAYARGVDAPRISITFPAAPEFLRLARLASADVGSRAGFDYEEIDDLRIAVSELCNLISGTDGSVLTIDFVLDGSGVVVEGCAVPGSLVENELSLAIVEAVVDEFDVSAADDTSRFRAVKRVANRT